MKICIIFKEGEQESFYPDLTVSDGNGEAKTITSKYRGDFLLGDLVELMTRNAYRTPRGKYTIQKNDYYHGMKRNDKELFGHIEGFFNVTSKECETAEIHRAFLEKGCSEPFYMDMKYYEIYMSVLGRKIPYPEIAMIPRASGIPSVFELLNGRAENIIESFNKMELGYRRGYLYECGSILEMIEALLYHFLRLGYKIGKCEHCHRWYAKSRLNERYCTRRSPVYDNHSCKTAVQYLNKMESEKDNEAKRVYKNLTQSYRNRINTSKSPERSIKLTIELNDFMETALKYKEAIRTKKCTPEQFIEWMNSKRVRRPRKKEK